MAQNPLVFTHPLKAPRVLPEARYFSLQPVWQQSLGSHPPGIPYKGTTQKILRDMENCRKVIRVQPNFWTPKNWDFPQNDSYVYLDQVDERELLRYYHPVIRLFIERELETIHKELKTPNLSPERKQKLEALMPGLYNLQLSQMYMAGIPDRPTDELVEQIRKL